MVDTMKTLGATRNHRSNRFRRTRALSTSGSSEDVYDSPHTPMDQYPDNNAKFEGGRSMIEPRIQKMAQEDELDDLQDPRDAECPYYAHDEVPQWLLRTASHMRPGHALRSLIPIHESDTIGPLKPLPEDTHQEMRQYDSEAMNTNLNMAQDEDDIFAFHRPPTPRGHHPLPSHSTATDVSSNILASARNISVSAAPNAISFQSLRPEDYLDTTITLNPSYAPQSTPYSTPGPTYLTTRRYSPNDNGTPDVRLLAPAVDFDHPSVAQSLDRPVYMPIVSPPDRSNIPSQAESATSSFNVRPWSRDPIYSTQDIDASDLSPEFDPSPENDYIDIPQGSTPGTRPWFSPGSLESVPSIAVDFGNQEMAPFSIPGPSYQSDSFLSPIHLRPDIYRNASPSRQNSSINLHSPNYAAFDYDINEDGLVAQIGHRDGLESTHIPPLPDENEELDDIKPYSSAVTQFPMVSSQRSPHTPVKPRTLRIPRAPRNRPNQDVTSPSSNSGGDEVFPLAQLDDKETIYSFFRGSSSTHSTVPKDQNTVPPAPDFAASPLRDIEDVLNSSPIELPLPTNPSDGVQIEVSHRYRVGQCTDRLFYNQTPLPSAKQHDAQASSQASQSHDNPKKPIRAISLSSDTELRAPSESVAIGEAAGLNDDISTVGDVESDTSEASEDSRDTIESWTDG